MLCCELLTWLANSWPLGPPEWPPYHAKPSRARAKPDSLRDWVVNRQTPTLFVVPSRKLWFDHGPAQEQKWEMGGRISNSFSIQPPHEFFFVLFVYLLSYHVSPVFFLLFILPNLVGGGEGPLHFVCSLWFYIFQPGKVFGVDASSSWTLRYLASYVLFMLCKFRCMFREFGQGMWSLSSVLLWGVNEESRSLGQFCVFGGKGHPLTALCMK